MIPLIDGILSTVDQVLDKLIPDANVRETTKAALKAQALEWYKAEIQDRESARKREVETKDPTTSHLAWAYTFGYFGTLAAIIFGLVHIAPAHEELVNILMGVLTAGQYSVLQYYFGSSHGSRDATATLGVIAKNGYH